jgi:ankyrin repeat protein
MNSRHLHHHPWEFFLSSNGQFCPSPTPTLSNFIKRRDWPAARSRLLVNPRDAQYLPPPSSGGNLGINGNGIHNASSNSKTPLHLCCLYRAPIDVIEMVLDAHPSAILTQDSAGWTPIHLAIMHGGDEDIALLLIRRGGWTAAAVQSPFAGSPLHLACRHGSPIAILEELIQSNAKMAAVPNENGVKPAQVVWLQFEKNPANRQVLEQIRRMRRERNPGGGTTNEVTAANASTLAVIGDLFERLKLLVHGVKKEEMSSASSLSSTSSSLFMGDLVTTQSELGNMSQFLEIAVHVFPEQLHVRDEVTGGFVLHLAASCPPVPVSGSSSSASIRNRWVRDHHHQQPHHSENENEDTIDILVRANPIPAAVRDNQGDFPLHLALTRGQRTWRSGIESLVKARPAPLQRRERHTGLYPFQVAAAFPYGRSEEESLETIFQLLVACPHVVNC